MISFPHVKSSAIAAESERDLRAKSIAKDAKRQVRATTGNGCKSDWVLVGVCMGGGKQN